MKHLFLLFAFFAIVFSATAQDSRGVPSTSTQATHQGVMSWDSVLGKWYPRTGVSLAAYTNYWSLEGNDIRRDSKVAIGIPSGSSYVAQIRARSTATTYSGLPIARFDNFDGSAHFNIFSNGSVWQVNTSEIVGFGDFVTETSRNGGAFHVVRNNGSGSSAYSAYVLNAYGNSWGMEMGSAANNGNNLTWNIDALGANIERMRLTTDGKLGIGTSSPQAKAHILGPVWVEDGSAIYKISGQVQATTGSFYFDTETTGDIWFRPGGNGRLGVKNSGAINISTFTTDGNIVTHNGSGDLLSTSPASILSTAGAFLQNGNSFGAKATLGTNDAYPLQFEVNNVVRSQITTSGNLNVGTTGSNNARATFATGGVESPQVMLKTAQDSVHLAVTHQNPNGSVTTNKGSLVLDGTNAKAYINTSSGETGSTYTRLNSGPVSVTRDALSNGVDIPGVGIITTGWYRVPAQFDGYGLAGVSYSFQNAGSGTGEIVLITDKAGTDVHGATIAVGDLQKDATGTGITVATGNLLRTEILSNSMTTPPTGLVVTYFFQPL